MLKQLAERGTLFRLTQFSIYTVEVANYEAMPVMRVRPPAPCPAFLPFLAETAAPGVTLAAAGFYSALIFRICARYLIL